MRLANALGVSPIALVQPNSFVGRLPVAARSTDGSAGPCELRRTLTGVAEFHQLLDEEGIKRSTGPRPPVVGSLNWKAGAEALAEWASRILGRWHNEGGTHLSELADQIEEQMAIDVLLRPFDGVLHGASITAEDFPFIAVDTSQPRRRALFTLAHELGHVLARDGKGMCIDDTLRGPDERQANAFASFLLMPDERLDSLINEHGRGAGALAAMYIEFGVSWESLIYRLHNRGHVNAVERDRLRAGDVYALLPDVDELTRSRLLDVDKSACRTTRAPGLLQARTWKGYEDGVMSIRPFADLSGSDPDDLLDSLRSEARDVLSPFDEDAVDAEPAFADSPF